MCYDYVIVQKRKEHQSWEKEKETSCSVQKKQQPKRTKAKNNL